MAQSKFKRMLGWMKNEAATIAVVISAVSLTVSLIGIFSYGPRVARETSEAQISAARETADEVARLQIEAAEITAERIAKLQIEAARVSAEETATMQIDATREMLSQTAEKHAEAVRTAPRPSITLTYNTETEVPPDSCPGNDSIETCRYLRIDLSNFPESESYRYGCWSRYRHLFEVGELQATSTSTVCPFSDVNDEVWVEVNGIKSAGLQWKPPSLHADEPTQLPTRSVVLTIGNSAVGEQDCQTNVCKYLDVALENFSDTTHTLDCLFSPSDSPSTMQLRPRQQITGVRSTRHCWYDGHDGVMWVVVDGVASNNVAIGQTFTVGPADDATEPPGETAVPRPPDLSETYHGETWITLSWRPHDRDPVGDRGTPEEFQVRYRISAEQDWIASAASTRYHNGSNRYIYQYYHRIEGLSSLRNYEAEVRQCNDSGCSEWSSYLFRTDKPIPPAPIEIRVVEVGRDYFILEWDPVPGAYNYDVYYVGGGSITSGGSNDTTYETVFTLAPDAEYVVTVNSCNDLQRRGDFGSEACGELEEGTVITLRTLR